MPRLARTNPQVVPIALIVLLSVSRLGAESGLRNPNRDRPNVLFILIDDLGWTDVGYNGSTFHETPAIDRLARQWMRFDACYTPSPMCSPTRVSILTGKHPARHGVTQWLPGTDRAFVRRGETARVHCPKPRADGIADDEITLGEVFQEAGYDTAFYGKWHMGKLKATGGPRRHGYSSQRAVIEENRCAMFHPFRGGGYFPNSKPGDNFTDLLTDAAIEFVTAERERPFYLHLAHFAMHAPIASKPVWRERFSLKAAELPELDPDRVLDPYGHLHQKLRQDDVEYAGELATLDRNVGRLIDSLRDAGLYDNTIVVLTGDNGGRSAYFHGHPTSNRPLRTGKTFVFEGGLRTPLLLHWPGRTRAGATTSVPVTSMDFYPTLLEMTGLPPRSTHHLDGVSLVPLVDGRTLDRETLYWHFPHYQGEGSYPASAIRKGPFKLILNHHHDDRLLYDVVRDPSETTDLATRMPERAATLDRELRTWLDRVGAHVPRPRE